MSHRAFRFSIIAFLLASVSISAIEWVNALPAYYPAGSSFAPGVALGSTFGSMTPVVGVAFSTPDSSATGTNLPVTFGQVFRQGDVPSGSTVTISTASGAIATQVDPKAYYPDGSLKHAIISTIAPVTTQSGAVYALMATGATIGTAGAAGGDQNELLPAVFAGGYNVTLELTMASGGVLHASSLEAYNLNGINQKWLSGSIANEWEVVMPLVNESGVQDSHLMAHFVIRSYRGTPYIRTDVTVENTWNFATGIKMEQYDAVIKGRNGEELFRENGVNHYVFSRWRELVWDNSNNPGTDTIFDTQYLVATNAISNYDRNLTMNLPMILQNLDNFYGASHVNLKLMGKGINTYAGMSAPGGRQELGIEMGYTVDYLLTQNSTLKKLWLKGIDRAGAWPMHVRDIHSGGIHTIDRYPYTWFDDNGTCRNLGYQVDPATTENQAFSFCTDSANPYSSNTWKSTTLWPETAHQPSFSFVPYLITGDIYYRDELKFWANFNLLNQQEFLNRKDRRLFWNQVRGQAWAMRTLAQAAWILPNSDPDQNYFQHNLDFNIQMYKDLQKEGGSISGMYDAVNGGYSASPLGNIPDDHPYPTNGEAATGTAPWMHDFVMSVFGFIYNLGYSEMHDPLSWTSKFVAGRMGSPDSEFCWLMASEYSLQTYSSGGTAYTNFKQAYDGTIGNLVIPSGTMSGTLMKNLTCGSQEMADARSILGWGYTGILQPNELSGYAGTSIGYAEDMQPALAAAVDIGATGAELGWSRFVSSTPNSRNSNAYGTSPEFDIWPRSIPQTYFANGTAILGFNVDAASIGTGSTGTGTGSTGTGTGSTGTGTGSTGTGTGSTGTGTGSTGTGTGSTGTGTGSTGTGTGSTGTFIAYSGSLYSLTAPILSGAKIDSVRLALATGSKLALPISGTGLTITSSLGSLRVQSGSTLFLEPTWDASLVAPVANTGSFTLASQGVNTFVSSAASFQHRTLNSIKVGSSTSGVGVGSGMMEVSYAILDATVPVGSSLTVFRSEDGINWTQNTPNASCIVGADRSCRFFTDHLSYFGAVYSYAPIISAVSTTTTSVGPGGAGGSYVYIPSILSSASSTGMTVALINQNPIVSTPNTGTLPIFEDYTTGYIPAWQAAFRYPYIFGGEYRRLVYMNGTLVFISESDLKKLVKNTLHK